MTYAGPAWPGMCSAGDHVKLESLVNRCRRLGYSGGDEPTLSELYSEADDRMFNGVVINPEHVGYFTSFYRNESKPTTSAAGRMAAKLYSQKPNHLMNRISLLGLCINIVIKFL